MKQFILLITSIFFIGFIYPASADYFEEDILGAHPEVDMIREIRLDTFQFKNGTDQSRYQKTLQFVNSIKNEAVVRFEAREISLYRQHDIITSLDSFVYTMNKHFYYQKKYEQTKSMSYKESARGYLEDSRGAYNRLRSALKKSAY